MRNLLCALLLLVCLAAAVSCGSPTAPCPDAPEPAVQPVGIVIDTVPVICVSGM